VILKSVNMLKSILKRAEGKEEVFI
jgi:hypothetical protein